MKFGIEIGGDPESNISYFLCENFPVIAMIYKAVKLNFYTLTRF